MHWLVSKGVSFDMIILLFLTVVGSTLNTDWLQHLSLSVLYLYLKTDYFYCFQNDLEVRKCSMFRLIKQPLCHASILSHGLTVWSSVCSVGDCHSYLLTSGVWLCPLLNWNQSGQQKGYRTVKSMCESWYCYPNIESVSIMAGNSRLYEIRAEFLIILFW